MIQMTTANLKWGICQSSGSLTQPGLPHCSTSQVGTGETPPLILPTYSSTSTPGKSETLGLDKMTFEEEEFAGDKLAEEVYQPDKSCPCVGEFVSTRDIAEEYIGGDPIFRRKILNLCTTHPSIRRIRRDGSCGWRALAYGFFELLLTTGSVDTIHNQRARMVSLSSLVVKMNPSTDSEYLCEMLEPTLGLLKEMSDWFPRVNKLALFRTYFNDGYENIASYVTYYFRLIAAAYMKHHPGDFQFFFEGKTVEEYCQMVVNADTEIEEAGIQAIFCSIYGPAGFGLNVLDLNRHETDHVNLYSRSPGQVSQSGEIVPYVNLLYRPGHYDLIYPAHPTSNMHISIVRLYEKPISYFLPNCYSHVLDTQNCCPEGFYMCYWDCSYYIAFPDDKHLFHSPSMSGLAQHDTRTILNHSPNNFIASLSKNSPDQRESDVEAARLLSASSKSRKPRFPANRVTKSRCEPESKAESERRESTAFYGNENFQPLNLDMELGRKHSASITEKHRIRRKNYERRLKQESISRRSQKTARRG